MERLQNLPKISFGIHIFGSMLTIKLTVKYGYLTSENYQVGLTVLRAMGGADTMR